MSAPRRAGDAVAAVQVVPNGQALAVVRSWLPPPADGDEDYDAMLDWGDQPERDEPQRPARRVARKRQSVRSCLVNACAACRLGLGAKYLSHARAAALMDPLERRMQRQLGANRAARLAVDGEEPSDGRAGRGGGFGGPARAGGEQNVGRGRGDTFSAAAEAAPAQVRCCAAAPALQAVRASDVLPTQAAADSDDEDELRTAAFKHKRAAPVQPLSAKKRRKQKRLLAERAG